MIQATFPISFVVRSRACGSRLRPTERDPAARAEPHGVAEPVEAETGSIHGTSPIPFDALIEGAAHLVMSAGGWRRIRESNP